MLNRNVESRKLKNKYGDYKKKWQAWKALIDNSGFGFDEEVQLITAPDDVWDKYIEVSRRVTKYLQY